MNNRIDIVDELCAAIEKDGRSVFNIAQAAGVGEPTLYHWLSGHIVNPRVDTLDKVARVLGLQLAFVDGQWTLRPVAASNRVEKINKPRMALWRFS